MRTLKTLCFSACLFFGFAASNSCFASDGDDLEARYSKAKTKITQLQEKAQSFEDSIKKKKMSQYGEMILDIENKYAEWKKNPDSWKNSRKLSLSLGYVEEILINPIPKDNRQNENLNPANQNAVTSGDSAPAWSH